MKKILIFLFIYKIANLINAQTIGCQIIDDVAKTARTGRVVKSADGKSTSYYKAVGANMTGTVTIPSFVEIDGEQYKVVEIGPHSFSNTKISRIVLPETITTIGDGAFNGCNELTCINFPSSLETIGDAFGYLPKLRKIIIPDIGAWCSVEKKSLIVRYPSQLFVDEYTEKKDLDIPLGVTSIGNYSFANFENINTVFLPNSVKSIGNSVFQGCLQLAFIELPECLCSIGDYAFRGCKTKYFVIPQSVESIGRGALDYENEALERLYCSICSPETIAGLKNSFSNNSNCVSLYVPYGTKNLYENSVNTTAFLKIEEIGEPLVANMQICKDGTIAEFLIEDDTNVQLGFGNSNAVSDTIDGYISIPSSVVKWGKTYNINKIGINAFINCERIDSIHIPKSIISIEKAFSNCSSLHAVSMENRNPEIIQTDNGCFDGLCNTAVLYVPAGTKERYEALEPWNKFSQIIESSPISAGDISARFDSKADLPIYLKNTETVEGLQFKLTLPDGVSVEEQDGTLLAATTERTEGMTIMGRKDPDAENSYLFVVLSLDGNAISGTEGAIMNVRLDIAQDIELGVHDIKVEDVYMTTSTFETLNPAESTSELTIKDFMPGDVNNDGIVNVTDAIGIVNYVLKNVPSTFVEVAADVNGDGIINVTDAIGIINMILNK